MSRMPKRLLDDVEFYSVALGIIFLPPASFLLESNPAVRWFAAPVFGAYSIWLVVRAVSRRVDPQHANRPPDAP
jgi:hypothetical protein